MLGRLSLRNYSLKNTVGYQLGKFVIGSVAAAATFVATKAETVTYRQLIKDDYENQFTSSLFGMNNIDHVIQTANRLNNVDSLGIGLDCGQRSPMDDNDHHYGNITSLVEAGFDVPLQHVKDWSDNEGMLVRWWKSLSSVDGLSLNETALLEDDSCIDNQIDQAVAGFTQHELEDQQTIIKKLAIGMGVLGGAVLIGTGLFFIKTYLANKKEVTSSPDLENAKEATNTTPKKGLLSRLSAFAYRPSQPKLVDAQPLLTPSRRL